MHYLRDRLGDYEVYGSRMCERFVERDSPIDLNAFKVHVWVEDFEGVF